MIKTFEDIVQVEQEKLRAAWDGVEPRDIARATMAASPAVSEHIQAAFPEIALRSLRNAMDSVRIEEIEALHAQLLERINGMA